MTLIHHLALTSEWQSAQVSGEYRRSTVGKSLDDEGFIHASLPDQVVATYRRYYSELPEVVLLTIDTDLLASPWQFDAVGTTEFPHIYGPLNLSAVIAAEPYELESQ